MGHYELFVGNLKTFSTKTAIIQSCPATTDTFLSFCDLDKIVFDLATVILNLNVFLTLKLT